MEIYTVIANFYFVIFFNVFTVKKSKKENEFKTILLKWGGGRGFHKLLEFRVIVSQKRRKVAQKLPIFLQNVASF